MTLHNWSMAAMTMDLLAIVYIVGLMVRNRRNDQKQ